jgi:SAM-dependent methyltransferase
MSQSISHKMICTLCDALLNKMADEYYFICETCGAYVKDKKFYLTGEKEKERYLEHHNDVENPNYQLFTSPITNAILTTYKKDSFGLDYGCGTGPVISKQLIEKGYKVKLYDPYFYPDQDYLNHRYNYIFSCEVFEHFYKPKKEMEKLMKLLKPGGQLYIMTQLYHKGIPFTNWYYRRDPTHVFIYTKTTFEYIASIFNLKIETITDKLIILKNYLHSDSVPSRQSSS